MGSVLHGFVDAFRHRGFVLSVLVLSLSAAGLEWVVQARGIRFRKLPLPLRRPLYTFNADPTIIAPYKVYDKRLLPDEMIGALGTDQYISWILEDLSKPKTDPFRYPFLFVTYYTGQPDQVPHISEVCYLGGGYTIESSESVDIQGVGLPDRGSTNVPGRSVSFTQSHLGVRRQPRVLYTFHANGKFCGGRTSVRLAIGNPLERYAYFSKVEVTFHSAMRLNTFGEEVNAPSKEATRKAAEAVMRVFLPLLVENHWPDWARRHASDADADARSAAAQAKEPVFQP